jgi:hypothetical protein
MYLIDPDFETYYERRGTKLGGAWSVSNGVGIIYRDPESTKASRNLRAIEASLKEKGEEPTHDNIRKNLDMDPEEYEAYVTLANAGRFAADYKFSHEDVAKFLHLLIERSGEIYDMINMTPMYYDAFLKAYARDVPDDRDDFTQNPRMKIRSVIRRKKDEDGNYIKDEDGNYVEEMVLRRKAKSVTVMNWITDGGLLIDDQEVSQTGTAMGWYTPRTMPFNLNSGTFAWDPDKKKPVLPHMLSMDGRDLTMKFIGQTINIAHTRAQIGEYKASIKKHKGELFEILLGKPASQVDLLPEEEQKVAELEGEMRELQASVDQAEDIENFKRLPRIMVKIRKGAMLYEYNGSQTSRGTTESFLTGKEKEATRETLASRWPGNHPLTLNHDLLAKLVDAANVSLEEDGVSESGMTTVSIDDMHYYSLLKRDANKVYDIRLNVRRKREIEGKNQITTKDRRGRHVKWILIPEISQDWLFRLDDVVATVPDDEEDDGIIAMIRSFQPEAYTWANSPRSTEQTFISVGIKEAAIGIDLSQYREASGDVKTGWTRGTASDERDIQMVNVRLDDIEFGRTWCVVHKKSLNDLKLGALAQFGRYIGDNWDEIQDYRHVIQKSVMSRKLPGAKGGAKYYAIFSRGDWVKTRYTPKKLRLPTVDAIGQIQNTRIAEGVPKYIIDIPREHNDVLKDKKYDGAPWTEPDSNEIPLDQRRSLIRDSVYIRQTPSIRSFNEDNRVESPVPEGQEYQAPEEIDLEGGIDLGDYVPDPGEFDVPKEDQERSEQAIMEDIQAFDSFSEVLRFFIDMSKDMQQFSENGFDVDSVSFDLRR